MTVRLLFFAGLRERIGRAEDERSLEPGTTVGALWGELASEHDLGRMAGSVSFAVNREYVPRDHPLCDGDEVAFIPPVSGGTGEAR